MRVLSNNRFIRTIVFALFFLLNLHASGQNVSGVIINQEDEPIPFANVFIKEIQSGCSADMEGNYFINLNAPGEYEFVYSAIGYESKTLTIILGEKDLAQDVVMNSSSVELDEIVVRASKRDPAYAIIQKASENRKKFKAQVQSSRSNVYVKATENIDKKEKQKRKKKSEEDLLAEKKPIDPFEEAEKKKNALLAGLNMLEMQITLNYQYPDNYKEERTAYQAYGNIEGLFIPNFTELDFNFYDNLVKLNGIAEIPLISPISRTAILSYKFKLIESKAEGSEFVHKIKVTPRKSGNATFKGFIYINDGIWNINRLELDVAKGGLKFYDQFKINQTYQQIEDSIWIPLKQEFQYETKEGKRKSFKGNTLFTFSEFKNNYEFPKKFFGNEVAVTKEEAYDRDSTYWQASRPEELTIRERKMIALRDSIKTLHESDAYQDSIQAAFNKISFWEVIWDGVGFRNNAKKQSVYIGSLAAMIDFEVVGGFRLGPYLSYFRRLENGKMFNITSNTHIGVRNKDFQGEINGWVRYNPMRLGDIEYSFGRQFQTINEFDAFLNQLKASNYILHDHASFGHRIELFNGFYLETDFEYSDRKSVENYDFSSFLNDFIESDELLSFENYQAFITDFNIAYTPGQKYMTEPKRKVILSSPYPTFTLRHQKGWKNVLSSDIDFDYVSLAIDHDVVVGVMGNSKYRLATGKFLNTKDLRFIDFKRFRQSDPYWYSHPLYSFQLLDTALTTQNLFFEAHHIHHFNGALINNVPLVKKLKVRVVAGAGFLWVQENNFRHGEIFAGLERTFKLGARRRLRLGVYGVAAESNYSKPQTDIKFSIDLIDTWKKNWSY